MEVKIEIGIDDGRREMMQVADLLNKYGLEGVFYIAPMEQKCNLNTREIKVLSERHEVGGHTLTHCRLTTVSLEDAKYEIEEGKYELEAIIGKPITKFAYPRGWFNEDLKRLVKEAGYLQARTTKMGIINIDGYNPYELPVTAQNYPRPEYEGQTMLGIINKFNEATEKGNYFSLMIHTDDILKYGQWQEIEAIFAVISHWKMINKV